MNHTLRFLKFYDFRQVLDILDSAAYIYNNSLNLSLTKRSVNLVKCFSFIITPDDSFVNECCYKKLCIAFSEIYLNNSICENTIFESFFSSFSASVIILLFGDCSILMRSFKFICLDPRIILSYALRSAAVSSRIIRFVLPHPHLQDLTRQLIQ